MNLGAKNHLLAAIAAHLATTISHPVMTQADGTKTRDGQKITPEEEQAAHAQRVDEAKEALAIFLDEAKQAAVDALNHYFAPEHLTKVFASSPRPAPRPTPPTPPPA